MLAAIKLAVEEAAADSAINAVVLAGSGRAFCAGHDLKEMTARRTDADGGRGFFDALFSQCTATMMAIRDCPVPVIAQVHGIATAAGAQLASTCDMVVAAQDARFGVNGIDSGLFCSTPMVAVGRALPAKKTFEMLTSGTLISAQEAHALGLANHIAPADALAGTVAEITARLAERPRRVLALGKAAFYAQLEMPLADAYAHTKTVIVDNMMLDDAREGIAAFIEKRKPNWPDQA